jgi:integrase
VHRGLAERARYWRLRNASTGGFRDLVYLALLTGCRYGELSRFKVADYNADVGTLSVRIAKGGKVRHVTLTDEAYAFVDRLVPGRARHEPLLLRDDGRAWKRAEQVRPMQEACARAGIAPAVGFQCATPHPRFAAGDAGGADGGDRPPARSRRHPHDRKALCASRAQLCGGYD